MILRPQKVHLITTHTHWHHHRKHIWSWQTDINTESKSVHDRHYHRNYIWPQHRHYHRKYIRSQYRPHRKYILSQHRHYHRKYIWSKHKHYQGKYIWSQQFFHCPHTSNVVCLPSACETMLSHRWLRVSISRLMLEALAELAVRSRERAVSLTVPMLALFSSSFATKDCLWMHRAVKLL